MKHNPDDNKPRDFKSAPPQGAAGAYPKVVYSVDGPDHYKVNNAAEEAKALASGFQNAPAPGHFGMPPLPEPVKAAKPAK
jgi:hypothetical protein